MSKIVITGGLGFIGSNLALELAKAGNKVLLIDSLDPSYGGNMRNISSDRTSLIQVNISDLRDRFSLKALLSDTSVIYNLAGQTVIWIQ